MQQLIIGIEIGMAIGRILVSILEEIKKEREGNENIILFRSTYRGPQE
jgi:hypothetical protein